MGRVMQVCNRLLLNLHKRKQNKITWYWCHAWDAKGSFPPPIVTCQKKLWAVIETCISWKVAPPRNFFSWLCFGCLDLIGTSAVEDLQFLSFLIPRVNYAHLLLLQTVAPSRDVVSFKQGSCD